MKSLLQHDAENSKSLCKHAVYLVSICLIINSNKNKVMFLRDFVDFFVIITTEMAGKKCTLYRKIPGKEFVPYEVNCK